MAWQWPGIVTFIAIAIYIALLLSGGNPTQPVSAEHSLTANITRYVGDKNVYIHCPFGGPVAVTWRIGDHFYSQSSLPERFIYVPGGMRKLSRIGTKLCLDHQNFWFMKNTVTFAWKFDGQPCDPQTSFLINSTECVHAHQPHNISKQYYSTAVMEREVTIPRRYLMDDNKKLMYFTISAESNPNSDACDNAELRYYITVSEEVLTEIHSATPYDKVCISVPSASQSRGALRIALPYGNGNDSVQQDHCDLICLAECQEDTILPNGCCVLHNKCSPVPLEDTVYSGIVTLCKKNMTEMFQLCFSNPTPKINETKIHLYYERSCTNARTRTPISVAEYVRAVVLNITVPPPQPNISVDDNSGEICIIPQLNESFPTDYHKIVITDVTGYEIFKNESVMTNCITVNSLLQHICAPFTISVVGHNLYGDSTPAFYIMDAGFNQTSWCECANMKVNLTLDYTIGTGSVTYNYMCSLFNGFSTDLESTTQFVIKLLGNNGYENSRQVQLCSDESGTSMLEGLECGSTYNSTIYFAHPNGNISDCPVRNANRTFTDHRCPMIRHFLAVLISILAIGVVILTIIIATCTVRVCKPKKWCCRKKNADPNSRENYTEI